MGSFISISLMTSITSLPLAFHCLSSSSGVKHLALRVNPSISIWNTGVGPSTLG
jgi:hypothetical protein